MAVLTKIGHARWILVVLLLSVVGMVAMFRYFRTPVPVVRVASPRYQDLNSSVSTNGKVLPIDGFEARAAFSGTVEKILVQVGDKVKPGQLLIKLRDPFAIARIATANANLEGAKMVSEYVRRGGSPEDLINFRNDLAHAQVARAEASDGLAALKNLQAKGAASAGEVGAQEHRLQLADATLKSLNERVNGRYGAEDRSSSSARLADARAGVNTAKDVLANANITSTIAGTVYSIPVTAYDFVPMGADLLRVADLTKAQVRAFFDEPDIGQLAPGQAVEVTWDARPNQSWHGHIQQVPLTVRPMGPRNVGECLIKIEDEDGRLLPNTDVTIKVTITQRKNVLTIPREALRVEGGANFVYRVLDGKLARTAVSVGLANLDRIEVTSGLSPQDVVALSSAPDVTMTDSLPVQVTR